VHAQVEGPGVVYPVSEIDLRYRFPFEDQPSLDGFRQLEVTLGENPDGFSVPSANRPNRTLRIADLGRDGLVVLDGAAIIEVCSAIVREFQMRGRVVRCRPSPDDIVRGEDRRVDRDTLELEIVMARVRGIRTYGSGERVLGTGGGPTNNPIHTSLRAKSPIHLPDVGAGVPAEGSQAPLLDVGQLEEYVARLSRHPGRTVGLVYSRASDRDGGLTVDLVVSESKPWAMYVQSSNTGTDGTGDYRNRIGFTNTQLTGNDDILQVEYLTSDFDEIQATSLSYEAPLPFSDSIFEGARFKLFGAMSSFDNDDLGVLSFSADFKGQRAEAGFRVLGNVFQAGRFFADLSFGLRAESLFVDDGLRDSKARDAFVLPSVGLRIERRTPFSSLTGGVEFEANLAGIAGTDATSVNGRNQFDGAGGLGRFDPDERFKLLRFDLNGSVFLEPLLDWKAWSDFSTPESSTLAHELALRVAGQYAFEDRLIPQEQAIAGGRDTVRGYDQAAAVGDSVFLASLEYRYHFPRSLRPRAAASVPEWLRWMPSVPDRFRVAPEQPGGAADWDLSCKIFLDAARVLQSDRRSFESHETLIGAGVGVELRLRQNIALFLDLGFPLEEGNALDVDQGDPVLHFSLTTLY